MMPCQGCAYRRDIPGDAHNRCTYDWLNADAETKQGFPRPASPKVAHWFLFPLNYDATWGPDACPAKAETADPEKTAHDSGAVAAMMGMFGQ